MKTRWIAVALPVAGCLFAAPQSPGLNAGTMKMKSCPEIAQVIATSARVEDPAPLAGLLRDLNCAAAHSIPEAAALELSDAKWDRALRRWEFVLRCVKREDCVPFLVWAHGGAASDRVLHAGAQAGKLAAGAARASLVESGQTALLTWEDGAVRVVLPVTCLEAGWMGQTVRVRLKHVDRIVRAEVVGAGELAANL